MTMIINIKNLATVLVKNPKSDPMLALKALVISLWIKSSTNNTIINGTMIMPSGGKRKLPIMIPIAAVNSPALDPPYLLTK